MPFRAGLDGVIAARTTISSVEGERGDLLVRGFGIRELAPRATFEEMVFLLLHGMLADTRALARLDIELASRRELDAHVIALLASIRSRHAGPMNALRMACGSLGTAVHSGIAPRDRFAAGREDALRLVAAFPLIVAAFSRVSRGLTPVPPVPRLSHAATFLYLTTGDVPDDEQVRALDTYWNAVADHGLDAPTVTARVIVSADADVMSAVTGAVGALNGTLDAGAPARVLELLREIGRSDRAEQVLRQKVARGERLPGFGYSVYRTRDPRVDVLATAAERLLATRGDRGLYELALAVEEYALVLFREYQPERVIQTNVEFYAALVLHGLRVPPELSAPVFAAGRVAGWCAHCLEQIASNYPSAAKE